VSVLKCQFDQCCDLPKGNRKYCLPCQCYAKSKRAREVTPKREVKCKFDGCHTFEPVSTQVYCKPCGCASKVKANADARAVPLEQQAKLFKEPQEYGVLKIPALADGTRVIIVGDTHIPFEHKSTLATVEKFWDDFQPHIEIYNGDIFDFYTVSSFSTNPSRAFDLQDEIDLARAFLERRAEKNPDARRILGEGNHEDRLRRWLWKRGPELQSLRALRIEELLGLDGMGFEQVNYRSKVDVLGFRVEHGYRTSKSSAHRVNVARLMAIDTGSSGLCGHSHGFSHYGWADDRGSHSYVEGGCLSQLTLEYAPFPHWVHAFTYGVVHANHLHIFPVRLLPDGFRCEGEYYPRV
jgi:hypothetical protein